MNRIFSVDFVQHSHAVLKTFTPRVTGMRSIVNSQSQWCLVNLTLSQACFSHVAFRWKIAVFWRIIFRYRFLSPNYENLYKELLTVMKRASDGIFTSSHFNNFAKRRFQSRLSQSGNANSTCQRIRILTEIMTSKTPSHRWTGFTVTCQNSTRYLLLVTCYMCPSVNWPLMYCQTIHHSIAYVQGFQISGVTFL